MILIFLIILLNLIVINAFYTKDLLHPTILFKSIWFVSAFVYFIFKDYWGFEISIQTLSIFLLGFISFDLGFIFLSNIVNIGRLKIRPENNILFFREQRVDRAFLIFFLTILLSILVIVSMINTVGITKIFSQDFFITFRQLQYDGSGEANNEIHLFHVLRVLGLSAFIFFITGTKENRVNKRIYILTMIVVFLVMFFSTGRMWLIALSIQLVIIGISHSKKNGKYYSLKTQINYLKKLFYISIIFLLFFFIYGNVTANKIDSSNAVNKIAIYVASPMIAFNETWQDRVRSSNYFGEYLFAPIYNIFDKLFFTNIIQERDRLPYVFGQNDFATNVYTFYDTQIRDFGVIAIPFVMFLIGMVISYLKYKSETELIVGFWTALYAYSIYALSISFFNDKFFGSSTTTYLIIIVYFMIFKTKIFNKSKYIKTNNIQSVD